MLALRVLVIADDPLARTGLASVLGAEDDLSVVGQVAGHAEILSEFDLYKPDVALWDLGVGRRSRCRASGRTARDAVSGNPFVADALQAGEAWASGARAVLARDTGRPALMAALQAVAQGLAVLAPDFRSALSRRREPRPTALQEPLTTREMEVLRLMAEGLANKTISARLGISEHTVKFHVNAVLGKLGAQNRTETVTLAFRWGLVHL